MVGSFVFQTNRSIIPNSNTRRIKVRFCENFALSYDFFNIQARTAYYLYAIETYIYLFANPVPLACYYKNFIS